MSQQPPPEHVTRIVLDPGSIWRATWVVIAVLAIAAFIRFFFTDASSVIFLLVMAFFFALAIEPVVALLATRMRRGIATGLVMAATGVFLFIFFWLFGGLLVQQLTSLVQAAPAVATSILASVNKQFGTSYDTQSLLSQLNLTTESVATYATTIAGGILGLVGGVLSAALAAFAFVFFAFYVSAGMPRLRTWTAGLFQPRHQVVFLTVWQLMLTKVGGYVAARIILALINGTASALFMLAIGMDYWLPLGIWTGLVAQFVPNVGTYIAIVLPVAVGLTSSDARDGILVLIFAIAYQQVENLTIEPRIGAKAVDVHPAVGFASAMMGASLFGVSGAALGVPVAATLVAMFDIYKQRYDVTGETEQQAADVARRSLDRHAPATEAPEDATDPE